MSRHTTIEAPIAVTVRTASTIQKKWRRPHAEYRFAMISVGYDRNPGFRPEDERT